MVRSRFKTNLLHCWPADWDTNYLKLKALVGHSVSGDITSKHCVQTTVDDLRQPMQQIADYLKEKMGMKDTSLLIQAN